MVEEEPTLRSFIRFSPRHQDAASLVVFRDVKYLYHGIAFKVASDPANTRI